MGQTEGQPKVDKPFQMYFVTPVQMGVTLVLISKCISFMATTLPKISKNGLPIVATGQGTHQKRRILTNDFEQQVDHIAGKPQISRSKEQSGCLCM